MSTFQQITCGQWGQDRGMMYKMPPEPILYVKDGDIDRGNSQNYLLVHT